MIRHLAAAILVNLAAADDPVARVDAVAVGAKVVTTAVVPVELDGRVVDDGSRLTIYTVERIDGGRLLVDGGEIRGWIPAASASTLEGAEGYYTHLIGQAPGEGNSFTLRGAIRVARGDPAGALADLGEAIRLAPGKAEGFFARAGYRYSRAEYREAIADLDAALRLAPEDPSSRELRGHCHYVLEEFDGALADYSEVIRLDPRNTEALFHRSEIYGRRGEVDRAIGDLDSVIRLEPGRAEAYKSRGMHHHRGRADAARAMADLDEAARLDPKDPDTFVDRGLALVATEPDRSIDEYSEAIRLSPEHAQAYFLRAIAREEKDADLILFDLDEAIRLSPSYLGALHIRARTRHSAKDFDGAIADLDRCHNLGPAGYILLARGEAWQAKCDEGKALADYEGAIRLSPDLFEAHLAAAWIRAGSPDAKFRDAQEAVKLAGRAVELGSPDDDDERASATAALAAAYAESGDFARAIKTQEVADGLVSGAAKPGLPWAEALTLYRKHLPFRSSLAGSVEPKSDAGSP